MREVHLLCLLLAPLFTKWVLQHSVMEVMPFVMSQRDQIPLLPTSLQEAVNRADSGLDYTPESAFQLEEPSRPRNKLSNEFVTQYGRLLYQNRALRRLSATRSG